MLKQGFQRRLLFGDVGRGPLVLDQLADAVCIIGLVGQHDGARAEMGEERAGDLPVMRLGPRQAEPDRDALRVDDTWILVVSPPRDRPRQ